MRYNVSTEAEFDAIDINAELFVQARELFDLFDHLDRGATSARSTA